jgi:hypothetical protein
MDSLESNTMRQSVLNASNDKCVDVVDTTCDEKVALEYLDKSYNSWNSLGVTAFTAMSVGACAFTVLSINSVVSLLSLNSAFSILSTNSAFAIGCVDKRFAVCFP